MEQLPSLIWFHNDMSPLGGAQREILTAIPTHKEKWNITFVTLNAPKEVCDFLNKNNIPLITPKKPWINPTGGFNEITAKTGKSQLKEWGCKYTELKKEKKPHYNLFICDKSKRIEEI